MTRPSMEAWHWLTSTLCAQEADVAEEVTEQDMAEDDSWEEVSCAPTEPAPVHMRRMCAALG